MLSISSTAPVRFKGHTAPAPATSPEEKLSKVWQEKDIYEPVLQLQGHALAQDAIQKCALAKTKQKKEAALFWLVSLLRKTDGKKTYINADGRDQNGIPLINMAAACNKPELTQLLRKHGASCASDQEIKATQDKLMAFCKKNTLTQAETQEAIAALKTPGININQSAQYSGHNALTLAAQEGHTDIVKALLQMPGININQSTQLGNNALTLAVRWRHTDIVKALLQMPGININQSTQRGENALTLAVWDGHTDIVKALLKTPGININHITLVGNNALTLAVYKGYTDIIKALLQMPDIHVKQAFINQLKKQKKPEDPPIIALLESHLATTEPSSYLNNGLAGSK